jgi:hypothetical protein
MGILVVGAALFGMILGQFYKWYVLVPACGLVIVLVLVFPAHREPTNRIRGGTVRARLHAMPHDGCGCLSDSLNSFLS